MCCLHNGWWSSFINEWAKLDVGASQFVQDYNWQEIKPTDCVRMQLFGFDWSHLRTNPYLLHQLTKTRIDCWDYWPIISARFLMGGSWLRRGGVFEVIQSVPLWFTLSACVWGDGVVGVKESPGGSASQNAFFLGARHRWKNCTTNWRKRPPPLRWRLVWNLFNATTAPHAQPTNAARLYQMLAS